MGRSSWVVGVFVLPLCLNAAALRASPITGVVVDSDGSPVAEARVILAEVPFPLLPSDGPLVLAEQTTEADGAFAFEDVGGRRLEVLAVHDGRLAATAVRDRAAGELRLTLPGPPWFTARVVRSDGTGVPGVRLIPRHGTQRAGDGDTVLLAIPDDVAEMLAAVSDETGRFELRGVRVREPSPGDWRRLSVEAPGCAPFAYAVDQRGTNDIVLPEAGSIRGRLYTEELGVPTGRVPVHAELDMNRVTAGLDVQTDKEGAFVFEGLPIGVWKLCVDPKGELPHAATPVRALVLPGKTAEVGLQLRPTTRVSGSVVDAATGTPMEGRMVRVLLRTEPGRAQEKLLRAWRTTDAQGQFSFRLPPEYEARLSCRDDYVTSDGAEIAPDQWGTGQDIVLPAIRATRTHARVADVTVLAPDGTPAAGASVLLPGGWYVTDGNGSATVFEVDLRREERWPVAVRGADASVGAPERAGDAKFVVRLQAGAAGRVSGRVADQDGAPLPGAEVTFGRLGRAFALRTTGPDGVFVTDALPAGITLSPEVTVKGAAPLQSAECTVEAGATFDLGDTTVRVAKAEVAGRVSDKDGQPVSAAAVFSSALPGAPRTESGPDGAFRLTGLWSADTYVFAEHPELGFSGVRVSAGQAAEIRLGDPEAMYVPTPPDAPTLEGRLAWVRKALDLLVAHGYHSNSTLGVLVPVAQLDTPTARQWTAELGVAEEDFSRRTLRVRLRTELPAALEDWRAAVPAEFLAWKIAETFYRRDLWPAGPSDEVIAAVEQYLPQADGGARALAMCALATACTSRDLPRAMAYSEEAWLALGDRGQHPDAWVLDSLADNGLAELALARPLEAVNLALANGIDIQYDHLSSIAEAAAHRNAELTRVLMLMAGDDPDRLADTACSVAAEDPDRALTVLEAAPRRAATTVKAYARVAEALQRSGHHEYALRAVDEAMALAHGLSSSRSEEESGSMAWRFARTAVAGHLVGHPRTGELVLRALSWRPPEPTGQTASNDAYLAELLAPVDKVPALFLVERSAEKIGGAWDADARVLVAAVECDPALGLQLLEAWLADADEDAAYNVGQSVYAVAHRWASGGR